jgi:hypothetical protein
MQSTVFFRACTGNDYELTVEHEDGCEVPKFLSEERDGTVQCLTTERNWPGLMEMTHQLKIEIKRWGSDVGD